MSERGNPVVSMIWRECPKAGLLVISRMKVSDKGTENTKFSHSQISEKCSRVEELVIWNLDVTPRGAGPSRCQTEYLRATKLVLNFQVEQVPKNSR
jgi:hypothetical protein